MHLEINTLYLFIKFLKYIFIVESISDFPLSHPLTPSCVSFLNACPFTKYFSLLRLIFVVPYAFIGNNLLLKFKTNKILGNFELKNFKYGELNGQ